MPRISRQQVDTSERFYMMPKGLFENDVYHDMKPESKLAYAILKDRFKLSLENNWVDKQGNVYLYYPNIKLGEKLGVGKDKVIRIKKELQKFGLLEEERQGFNKPNRLYICNLELKNVDQIPAKPSDDKEVLNCDFRYSQNTTSGILNLRTQEVSKCDSNDTELNETDLSEIENIKDLDDEENYNINAENSNTKNSSSDSLIAMGELLAANQDVRSLVHVLIPDLLLDDPEQASVVVNALVHAKTYLLDELHNGNTILAVKELTYGEDSIITIIKQAAEEQLAYMSDHLTNYQKFGSYFSKGLDDRVHIAITTRQSVSRLSI
ncbi:replication initiator protein A [Leuconostoc inhae]|uniref:Replication initiator protein A n=2 Tax=Leuconostoc TaxID=1243 RepID=A0AAN2QVA0_9LACO|nr:MULTISPECIES: replication initiator protein A [Leuconostoc]MBM7435746.1 hypothetical protein [Leuconostoc rapi]MBZ5947966.1 replication initiator protein A [Leuconostoc gasicomitatum]MBZ5958956.1 replication initiator protein A [Leuconostoc gasicomitatum]MBZ5980557.1 replication initiator protein A [Leuconostoc gasicomitatum]MBZ5982046.1 replication initiator protein A [Leuconostoc gasicomitatum]